MTTNNMPNRLAKEKSPYLLQHAHNPVDWFPWSEEAFDEAKRENKPIFLSIGYSTCHWCHVMEKESFEDAEVAELLNRDFVAIKVDREERPDIDHVYMTVCQAMTGQGGWPLTIVMTPDKKPFFAGTYFPKHRRFNRFGLVELLPALAAKWQQEREQMEQMGETVVEETQKRTVVNLSGDVSEEALAKAYEHFEQSFDDRYGGFGSAPKFPSPHNLLFLLRHARKHPDSRALEMVETTLDRMARGGIYDHIGFGFARYSTDEQWLVPHFEKMLYDNATLAIALTEAFKLTRNAKYRKLAEEIFSYVMRDMTDKEGGFYSAEDADSEGEEGKFYVWSPDEAAAVLGDEDAEWFCELYDITDEGNFEGKSIPNLLQADIEAFAGRRGLAAEELRANAEQAREKLFRHREGRVHPHKDDKILTSWNGLMIAALAKAGASFGEARYVEAAERASEFVRRRLYREDGRLLARFRDGEAAFPGYIDDYAFFAWGLLELYEAAFRPQCAVEAKRLADEAVRLFWDGGSGGFYFYGNDGEELFTRNKELYDGAIPSGNSVMLHNLLRLWQLFGEQDYLDKAEEMIRAFGGAIAHYPAGHAMFLAGMDMAYSGMKQIVVAGGRDDPDTEAMLRTVRESYVPNAVTMFRPEGEGAAEAEAAMPGLQGKTAIRGKPAAYVCENFSCHAPVTDPEALVKDLQK